MYWRKAMKQLKFSLTDRQAEWVEGEAARIGITPSEFMRRVLDPILDGMGAQNAAEQNQKPPDLRTQMMRVNDAETILKSAFESFVAERGITIVPSVQERSLMAASNPSKEGAKSKHHGSKRSTHSAAE